LQVHMNRAPCVLFMLGLLTNRAQKTTNARSFDAA
jgi:hypothetical protein